jgi:hypothetical protein
VQKETRSITASEVVGTTNSVINLGHQKNRSNE